MILNILAVAAVSMIDDDEDIIIISSDGIIIRIKASDISTFSRTSKGVRVMKVSEGEKVSAFSITAHDAEEKTDELEASEDDAEGNEAEVSETEE